VSKPPRGSSEARPDAFLLELSAAARKVENRAQVHEELGHRLRAWRARRAGARIRRLMVRKAFEASLAEGSAGASVGPAVTHHAPPGPGEQELAVPETAVSESVAPESAEPESTEAGAPAASEGHLVPELALAGGSEAEPEAEDADASEASEPAVPVVSTLLLERINAYTMGPRRAPVPFAGGR